MVIEDLHWADEATLDVLAPLSPDAVERLAWKAGRSSARLHATTAGNPYFVNEVVASSASGVPAREPATSR